MKTLGLALTSNQPGAPTRGDYTPAQLAAFLSGYAVVAPAVDVGTAPEDFTMDATTVALIRGVPLVLDTEDGQFSFSAAHAIAANKWGVIGVQVGVADAETELRDFANSPHAAAVSTKVPASSQSYDTEDEARAAGDLLEPDDDNVWLGYWLIHNNAGAWVGNTDDLTDGSDVATAEFIAAA